MESSGSSSRGGLFVPDGFFDMMRILVLVLGFLHLGPGLAFAALAFDCQADTPLLGPVCGRPALEAFVLLTLLAWAVLGLGYAATRMLHR